MGLFSNKNNKKKEQETIDELKKAQELRNRDIIQGCNEHSFPIPYYYDENGDVQIGEGPKTNSVRVSDNSAKNLQSNDNNLENDNYSAPIEDEMSEPANQEKQSAQELRNREIIDACNEHSFPIPYYYDENGDVHVGDGPEMDDEGMDL